MATTETEADDARLALHHMLERGTGRIVNTSSIVLDKIRSRSRSAGSDDLLRSPAS